MNGVGGGSPRGGEGTGAVPVDAALAAVDAVALAEAAALSAICLAFSRAFVGGGFAVRARLVGGGEVGFCDCMTGKGWTRFLPSFLDRTIS